MVMTAPQGKTAKLSRNWLAGSFGKARPGEVGVGGDGGGDGDGWVVFCCFRCW